MLTDWLTDWLNEERLEHARTFCLQRGGERRSFVQGGQLYWAFPFSKDSLGELFTIINLKGGPYDKSDQGQML